MEQDPTQRTAELLEHTRWLRGLARHLVADSSQADDLVQMTYLAALERPGVGWGGPRAWWAGVVRNVARQQARSESRRTRRERASARPESVPSADDMAGVLETQQLLSRAVLELDEPYRTTVFLRYFEDLTPARIAARLNVPAATVRVRLKRGLARLRERLDSEHGGDRAAWGAALLPLFVPTRGELLSSAVPTLSGALAMSVHLKLLVGVAVLVGASAVIWRATSGAAAGPPLVVAPAAPGSLTPVAGDVEPPARPLETARREVGELGRSAGTAPAPGLAADPCCVVGRVLDPDGAPVAGARLEAVDGWPRDPELLVVLEEEPRELATVSDPDGRYRLELPAARPYLVRALHPAFAPGSARHVFAGERRDFALERGSVLRVTVLTREGERPLAGVVLTAHSVESYASPSAWSLTANSAANGVAELSFLPPGEFLVAAALEGYVGGPLRFGVTDEPRTEIELRMSPESIVTGQVLDAATERPLPGAEISGWSTAVVRSDSSGRFVLGGFSAAASTSNPIVTTASGYSPEVVYVQLSEPGTTRELVVRLKPASRVSGRVIDSLGSPVAGAALAYRGSFSTNPFTAERHEGRTRTDGYGRFVLDDVHPTGEYTLVAGVRGLAAARVRFGPLGEGGGEHELEDLVLGAAGSIEGVVRGRVRDALGPDLVRLGRGDLRVAAALVDPEGHFRLDGLPAGTFELTLHPWDPVDRGPAHEFALRRTVTLAEGELLGDVILEPATPVRGFVLKPDGSPARGARVTLHAGGDGPALAVVSTDGQGAFELPVDGPGPHRLSAADPSLLFDSTAVDGVRAGSAEIELRLRPRDTGIALTGRLTDEEGAPVADVYVHFTSVASGVKIMRVAIPDEQGWWSMKNLDDEAYDLAIVDFGDRYEPARRAAVRPDGPPVEFVLIPRR